MSLSVKMSAFISSDCKSLYFFDKTGIYDATSNTTGYGTPNADTSDFATATLTITIGGATDPLSPIDIFASFPSSDVNDSWVVTAASQGLDVFPAGLTRVRYDLSGTFSGDSIGFNPSKLILSDCDYCCQLKTMQADIAKNPPSSCSCETDTRVTDMLYFEGLLEAAQAATCSGDVQSVNSLVTTLNSLC